MKTLLTGVVVMGAVLAAPAALPAQAPAKPAPTDASIRLVQGRGDHRARLDAISYKPLDPAVLGGLEGWTGTPVTAADLKGRPALIVAWAGWFRNSYRGLADAQRLADDPDNKDLAVVLVHHQTNFAKGKEALAAEKIKVPTAHDAGGGVFKALLIDGAGPNYYIVDRAGNLRFADVERSSLTQAVKLVLGETVEEAASALDRARAQKDAKGAESAPLGGPAVKARPTPEDYARAAWPKAARRVEHAKNVQGKALPAALGKETWLTDKKDLTGKVVVLDFWAVWCPPCVAASPILDELQTEHKDAVVVLAMSGQNETADKIKNYLKTKKSGYSHAHDAKQTVYKSLGIQAIPHVVVMSSDGVVRWQGNPHDPEFTKAVDAVVAADPWVQAKAKK